MDDVYTMHANCCRGLKAKLIDLRNVLDESRSTFDCMLQMQDMKAERDDSIDTFTQNLL